MATSFLTRASNWGELWCTTNNKSKLEVTCASVSSELVSISIFVSFFSGENSPVFDQKIGNFFFKYKLDQFLKFFNSGKKIISKNGGPKK